MAEPADMLPSAIDVSPLIFLMKAELLDLLHSFYERVLVPTAVVNEVSQYGADDLTAKASSATDWLEVAPPVQIPSKLQNVSLGNGETSVLAWSLLHPGTEVILDDLAARRCASKLGLPVRGTLGLAIAAKQRGYVEEARPLIEQLKEAGMYLSDSVINRALALVDE
ncbi:MAG: DUF3368 domain-containing protein [Cyanobacteria bacterium P01_A01_bin.3]